MSEIMDGIPLANLVEQETAALDGYKAIPLVTLALAAYDEVSLLEKNLQTLCDYMDSLKEKYEWELVLINDGSTDNTGAVAEIFAKSHKNVRVFHHSRNEGLGRALQNAFSHSRGDYIITLDVDLSYAPGHIGKLLSKIEETKAKVVIASPSLKEGKMSHVPMLRRVLSKWANRLLSFFFSWRGNEFDEYGSGV